MERPYYLNDGKQQIGPLSLEAIRQARPQGITHVWYDGAADWMTVDSVPEVKEALAAPTQPPQFSVPPPAQPPAMNSASGEVPRSSGPITGVHSPLADELDKLYRGMVSWCVLFVVALVVTLVLVVLFVIEREEDAAAMTGLIGGLATLTFAIVFTVHWCKLHYRHWMVVCERTGFKDFTPGQAVGFLFIPLFSLYWVFPSYQKLSELINHVLASDTFMGQGPRVNAGTATAMCVLRLVGVIPYIGALAALVNIFVWFQVHAQNRTAVTWILRSGL